MSIVKHLRQFATIHITLLRFALVCTVIVISRVGTVCTHPPHQGPTSYHGGQLWVCVHKLLKIGWGGYQNFRKCGLISFSWFLRGGFKIEIKGCYSCQQVLLIVYQLWLFGPFFRFQIKCWILNIFPVGWSVVIIVRFYAIYLEPSTLLFCNTYG